MANNSSNHLWSPIPLYQYCKVPLLIPNRNVQNGSQNWLQCFSEQMTKMGKKIWLQWFSEQMRLDENIVTQMYIIRRHGRPFSMCIHVSNLLKMSPQQQNGHLSRFATTNSYLCSSSTISHRNREQSKQNTYNNKS